MQRSRVRYSLGLVGVALLSGAGYYLYVAPKPVESERELPDPQILFQNAYKKYKPAKATWRKANAAERKLVMDYLIQGWTKSKEKSKEFSLVSSPTWHNKVFDLSNPLI